MYLFCVLLAQEMLPTAEIRINNQNSNNEIIDADEDVVLTCMSSGETSAVTWKRNNEPVVASTTFEIGETGELIVRDFSEGQAGNYTCVVGNSLGAVSSATVTLQLPGWHFTEL